jgi:hypothetical protein
MKVKIQIDINKYLIINLIMLLTIIIGIAWIIDILVKKL